MRKGLSLEKTQFFKTDASQNKKSKSTDAFFYLEGVLKKDGISSFLNGWQNSPMRPSGFRYNSSKF